MPLAQERLGELRRFESDLSNETKSDAPAAAGAAAAAGAGAGAGAAESEDERKRAAREALVRKLKRDMEATLEKQRSNGWCGTGTPFLHFFFLSKT